MKKRTVVIEFIVFILFSLPIFFQLASKTRTLAETLPPNHIHKGTAIVITGAAARIPQEAALLEQLYNSGELKDIAIISGASSGSLNTVMLNAILKGSFTWDRYKNVLYSLKNEDVFIRKDDKMPVDTRPLRELLERIVNDTLGYYKMGDLPYASALSATNIEVIPSQERSYRFSNRKINKESNPDYNLVDVLMASTAIPIVFPSVELNLQGSRQPITFIDGGVAEDRIPFKAVIQHEQYTGIGVEKMIIVSKKSNHDPDIGAELKEIGIKDTKLLDKLGISLQRYSKEGFIKKLKYLQKTYPDLASHTYIYVPDFDQDFSLLDFDILKEQYQLSANWASSHKPILLAQYITENDKPVKQVKTKDITGVKRKGT